VNQVAKMKRAEKIPEILIAFKHEPLKEEDLDDFFYKDTMEIRTGSEVLSPVRKLFEDCITPSTYNAHLFMGHRGCGKSAELKNLKREFEKVGHYVHMVDSLIETEPYLINHWDILILITEGLCTIARNHEISIPEEPLDAIRDILCNDIEVVEFHSNSNSSTKSTKQEIKTPSILNNVINLLASLKQNLKVSTETRETVTTKMPKRAVEWLAHMKEISFHLIAECNQKHPIIIFEDLDKIPMPEKIFEILNYSVLAQMPFPVIYTFPIDQYFSTSFESVKANYIRSVLPMIKVCNKDNSINNKGLAVIKKIAELRANLELFDDGVLDELIVKTGGSLRHLFECITSAARVAKWREANTIGQDDAKSALNELSKDITRKITTGDYKHLRKIIESKEEIDDVNFQLNMMRASIVFEYENGSWWYDVHPLIVDFLKTKGETSD
jgi:hypothetical protein